MIALCRSDVIAVVFCFLYCNHTNAYRNALLTLDPTRTPMRSSAIKYFPHRTKSSLPYNTHMPRGAVLYLPAITRLPACLSFVISTNHGDATIFSRALPAVLAIFDRTRT